jgi:hypothetical protein
LDIFIHPIIHPLTSDLIEMIDRDCHLCHTRTCARVRAYAVDVFDDLLARALHSLSHCPLLSDYDEPETLS